MSFRWDDVDARNRAKQERELEVRNFLLRQQEDMKNRKLAEKMGERADYAKMFNGNSTKQESSSQAAFTDTAYGAGKAQQQKASQFSQQYASYQPQNTQVALPSQFSNTSITDQVFSHQMSPNTRSMVQQMADLERQPSLQDDSVLAKLRLAEEQLQSERRSRSWLETELQLGKSLIATLSAKVERMQETINTDSTMLRDVVRQSSTIERRLTESDQAMGSKLEREQLKLNNAINDLAARLRVSEQQKEEEAERNRLMADEINQMRYRLESFSIKTLEVGTEVRNRVRDWEAEAQRGADVVRIVKEHEGAIDNLQRNVEGSAETLSKRMEMSLVELRGKFDQEARSRYSFEVGMRDLFNELKKTIGSLDRDVHDRIESTRSQTMLAIDRERQERDKSFASTIDQLRQLERGMRDAQQVALDKMASQVNGVEDHLSVERTERGKFEAQIKTAVEDTIKAMQDNIEKKLQDFERVQEDTRQGIVSSLKALKESIALVEKASERKLESVEEVLRAEIKARMETDRTLNAARDIAEARTATLERRAFEAIADVLQDTKAEATKIQEDMDKAFEQMVISNSRLAEDVDKQLSQVRKRINETGVEVSSKFRQLQLGIEQANQSAQEFVQAAEARMEGRLASSFVNQDELSSKIRDAEAKSEEIRIQLEDKMNTRAAKVDVAFEAFKLELDMRVTKKDEADLEKVFESSLANVQVSVSRLVETCQSLRDDLELRATHKDLDDVESRSKNLSITLQSRMTETDETIIAIREDLSGRSLKKDVEELEGRIKGTILDLQVRDAEIENQIDRVREEVASRVSREQMAMFEHKSKEQIQSMDIKNSEVTEKMVELRDAIAMRATKLELNDLESKLNKGFRNLDGQITEVSSSVLESKGELSKAIHDDLEDMLGKINDSMSEIRQKTETFEGLVEALKIRISDSDISARSRLQQVATNLEGVIAEHNTTVASVKEMTEHRLSDFAAKLEELPNQLSESKEQQEDFKRKILDMNRAESDKINQLVSALRESMTQMVTDKEFDRLQSEIHTTIQKISTKVDIDSMTAEQMRLKVQELEAVSKEKQRDLKAIQERNLGDQMEAIRNCRESFGKKVEDLETRIAGVPKAVDQAWTEIRRLRSDVDDKLRGDLLRVERDVSSVKGEISSRVTEKYLDHMLKSSVAPIINRIDRVYFDVNDLRAATDKVKAELAAQAFRTMHQRDQLPPIPPHQHSSSEGVHEDTSGKRQKVVISPKALSRSGSNAFVAESDDPSGKVKFARRLDSAGSIPRSQLQFQGSDPNLERIADLAAGVSIPPVSKMSSQVSIEY